MAKSSKTQAPPEPLAEVLVTDLETLKVLSDPLRLQILELMAKPSTVKAISKTLGIPATKLYYHVGQLEERKIVQVVDTRVVSGIIEKQYQVTAKSFKVDRSLLRITNEDTDSLLEFFSGLMDGVALDIQQGIRSGLIEIGDGHPRHRRLMLSRTLFKMTPDQAEQFTQDLDRLLNQYATENQDPAAQPYSLLAAFHLHSKPAKTKKPKEKA